jgi:hypothetical protein
MKDLCLYRSSPKVARRPDPVFTLRHNRAIRWLRPGLRNTGQEEGEYYKADDEPTFLLCPSRKRLWRSPPAQSSKLRAPPLMRFLTICVQTKLMTRASS